ncbi:tetratricopeptide repeat protein [Dyella choica]|uniref:Tetratricopeptide repeat protein n=1 Tax=Dyella choica TaxID=1927959 RepID=A0A3S0WUD6_9GAMM|nr:tetratricopeptide repeat protein [Dyella choica]RUL72993.1 tetratricopeptide repeat protein [Dyella choica]
MAADHGRASSKIRTTSGTGGNMDGNGKDARQTGFAAQPLHRLRLAIAPVLLVFAIPLLLHVWDAWHDARRTQQANANYATFMAEVRRAEGIADPLQRCLHYPNIPGTHWHDDSTQAYCRLLNPPSLSQAQIASLLSQGKAGEVDTAFQGYLDAQLRDSSQPGAFEGAFYAAGFRDSDAGTRKLIDQWKQQAPTSAFALVASGMQYLDAAQQARGEGWVSELTNTQVRDMNTQLVLARNDLDRAVSLLPTATAAYREMIYLAALSGDDVYMYQAAEAGLKVDPANFHIRKQMMNQSQPKWGGMFGGVRKQRQEAEDHVARNPLLRMVTSMPAVYAAQCDCGYTKFESLKKVLRAADDNVDGNNLFDLAQVAYHLAPRPAIELYSESLRFNPTDADILRWRAELMMKLGDANGAVQSVLQMAQRFPDNNEIAVALGNIYGKTGHVQEAEHTYEAILQRDPDDEKAMAWLGDLYNHAGHQPEKAKVLADTLIRRYPDIPDGYIVRACYLMDHDLPGRYETMHYFIDHFGDRSEFQAQVAEMRAYLVTHPEKIGQK